VRNVFYYFILFVLGYRLKHTNFWREREDPVGIRRKSVSDGSKDIANISEQVKNILNIFLVAKFNSKLP
jgi:hypothetical protein